MKRMLIAVAIPLLGMTFSGTSAYAQATNAVDACRAAALFENKVFDSAVNAHIDKCMADNHYTMDPACKTKERVRACYTRSSFWWLNPRKNPN